MDGKGICDAAQVASFNANTARSVISRYQRDGKIARSRGGNNKLKIHPAILKEIEEAVEQNPEATLKQIQALLKNKEVILSVPIT